jgi:hypothetical protein
MARRAHRRLLCLATAALFAISSAAHVYAVTAASLTMPTAMEAPAPDHAMDCGGDDKAAHAACVAMCATSVAILSEPAVVPVVVARQNVERASQLPPSSRGPSPEPHPPKR